VQELLRFKAALDSEVSTQQMMQQFEVAASNLARQLETAHTHALAGSDTPTTYANAFNGHIQQQGVPGVAVETSSSQLDDLLARALGFARHHCTMHTTTDRHYQTRTTSRRVRELDLFTCLLNAGRRELERDWAGKLSTLDELLNALQGRMQQEVDMSNAARAEHVGAPTETTARNKGMLQWATTKDISTALGQLRERLSATAPPGVTTANSEKCSTIAAPEAVPALQASREAIEASLREHRKERRDLLRTDHLKAWGKAVAAWRKKYARRPRWGHKDIAARDSDAPRGIEVLKEPATGKLTSKPADLLHILREQRTETTAAVPMSGKTGTTARHRQPQGSEATLGKLQLPLIDSRSAHQWLQILRCTKVVLQRHAPVVAGAILRLF
jgi:hypothetical protein